MTQHFDDRTTGSNFEQFIVFYTRFGQPIDLTGATSTLTMTTKDGDPPIVKINAAPCAAGSSNGRVVYQPTVIDLDTPGRYWIQTTTTMPGGEVLISERIGVVIRDDI